MIAAWKRQAIEGLASTFSCKAEAMQATGEAELTRLHAKMGQLVVKRDFLAKVGVVQIRVTRETWNPLVGAALATFDVTYESPVLNHAHNARAEWQALYDRLGLVGQNRTVPQVVLRDGGFDYRIGGARELRGSGLESLFRKGPAMPPPLPRPRRPWQSRARSRYARNAIATTKG